MIESTIMSVREMIDVAFGEQDVNKVDFKMMQTILYILARQLRILERQVGVNVGLANVRSTSSLFISEIKLQAKVPKPKMKKTLKSSSRDFDVIQQEKKDKEKKRKASKQSDKSEHPVSKYEELKKKDLQRYIEDIEQNREHVLRIVEQRANSREEADSPMPMAPLDSKEYVQYEKLLVVERIPAERRDRPSNITGTPTLSIVTQEQFEDLNDKVKGLQERFGAVGVGEFPENVQLMKDLRKGASLTDAMAALQLSARIDAAEKTLEQLMTLLADLANRKGIDVGVTKEEIDADKKKPLENSFFPALTEYQSEGPRWVSVSELEDAMQQIHDDIINKVTALTAKTSSNAENAIKIAANLEKGLSNSIKLDNRMDELEDHVSEYADRINILDTSLSSQMTHYQEQLTQMQHELEAAIESMAEAVANSSGDPAAVAELNTNLSTIQTDLDFTNTKQKELEQHQNLLSSGLQSLLRQIETLRDTKADREEVVDALRDKAGLDALNGLVTQQEFNAVRGDLEKRIKAAYNKFDSQELKWQQAIDDLQRKLDDRADLTTVRKLRDDINEHLETLRNTTQTLMDIVGEPRAAAVSKVLFRDTACISCLTPAQMNMKVEPNLPLLPACLTPEGRKAKPKEDGDHGVCYPGLPIPHPIDPIKGRICHRYCGGSHTTTANARNKLSTGVTVRPAARTFAQGVGLDEKMFKTPVPCPRADEDKCPCVPCNVNYNVQHSAEIPGQTKQVVQEVSMLDTSPLDGSLQYNRFYNGSLTGGNVSVTPPYIED